MQELTADLVTIGAGGGAYPAAFRLARAGSQVVMVDPKGVMSGNCLAEGCVPSKAMREVAQLYRRARAAERMGITGDLRARYQGALDHKTSVQKLRYRQHEKELASLAPRLRLLTGSALVLDPHTVLVEGPEGGWRISADSMIVASGSDITVPDLPGAELCLTSRDLFALEADQRSLPNSLVVIGAGYIGLEVAGILHTFGTRVEVLEMEDQILPGMDPDFGALLQAQLDPGIEVRLGSRVESVELASGGRRVVYSQAGEKRVADGEQVLLAVGRHPVLPPGLVEAGVQVDRGRPRVNHSLQTSLAHVYAPGDVNGRSMLFHSAVRQSLVAASCIQAGHRPVDQMDFGAVPTTIFTFPEAAYVGLLRAGARQSGIEVLEAAYSFEEDSRAQILGEMEGELRLFFAPGSLRLLGGWVVGVDAAQLIGEIGTAVSAGLTAHQLARFPDQHPMAAEGIGKAARQLV
jgi:dihydrolipoamide dehydrogenase